MNIGKNVTFLQLRKILPGIFAGAPGFWISMGVVFSILLLLLFLLIFPRSNQYARAYQDMQDLSIMLEKYAAKKDLYNNAWIASTKQQSELYDKELEKCKAFLKEKDERLEAIFSREDTEKGLMKIEDEALWKNEYMKRVSLLLTKLETHNVAISEGALPFHRWGPDIPAWDTILPEQKKFWILEAIVNVSLNDTGVRRLEKITFRESSPTYEPSFAQLYTVIPITIKVELPADRIQFLLRNILKSDILFVVENVTILSTDSVLTPESLTGNESALSRRDTSHSVPPSIIDIVIDAYVIDYKA